MVTDQAQPAHEWVSNMGTSLERSGYVHLFGCRFATYHLTVVAPGRRG